MKIETLLMIAGGIGAILYFKKKADTLQATQPVAVAQKVSPLREEDSEFFVDMVPYPVYPYPYWGGSWGWGGGWGGGRGGGGHHHGRHR
jgi:hypothetical protein